MWIAAARRRVAALRQPASAARIARGLWVAWAVIVWNVVFDHAIVAAGRRYIVAAGQAAHTTPFVPVNMDEWMRPAVSQGAWTATAAAGAILVAGLALVHLATRRSERAASRLDAPGTTQVTPCA